MDLFKGIFRGRPLVIFLRFLPPFTQHLVILQFLVDDLLGLVRGIP